MWKYMTFEHFLSVQGLVLRQANLPVRYHRRYLKMKLAMPGEQTFNYVYRSIHQSYLEVAFFDPPLKLFEDAAKQEPWIGGKYVEA